MLGRSFPSRPDNSPRSPCLVESVPGSSVQPIPNEVAGSVRGLRGETVVIRASSSLVRAVKREVQDTALSRILCVSPLFVPEADPEAFCGAKLCLALPWAERPTLTVLRLRRDGVQLDQSPLSDPLHEHVSRIPPLRGRRGTSSIIARSTVPHRLSYSDSTRCTYSLPGGSASAVGSPVSSPGLLPMSGPHPPAIQSPKHRDT